VVAPATGHPPGRPAEARRRRKSGRGSPGSQRLARSCACEGEPRMNMRHLAAACALLAATPCLAAIQWAGDFESGNLNQYTGKQEVSTDRLTVVADPVHQGKYALRVLVRQGD